MIQQLVLRAPSEEYGIHHASKRLPVNSFWHITSLQTCNALQCLDSPGHPLKSPLVQATKPRPKNPRKLRKYAVSFNLHASAQTNEGWSTNQAGECLAQTQGLEQEQGPIYKTLCKVCKSIRKRMYPAPHLCGSSNKCLEAANPETLKHTPMKRSPCPRDGGATKTA
jgi:hypothetical protein